METALINQEVKRKTAVFEVQLNWLSDDKGVLSAIDVKGVLPVATPIVFGGKGNDWSPEHLLLGALSSCFMSTYLSFAKKFRFQIVRMECNATGSIEPVDGRLRFTMINIFPKVYIANYDYMSKAKLALEKAEEYCLVSNSISAKIECTGDVIEEKPELIF